MAPPFATPAAAFTRTPFHSLLIMLTAGLAAFPAAAQSTWKTTVGSGRWGVPSNWTPSGIPADVVTFPDNGGAYTVTYDTTTNAVASLWFSKSGTGATALSVTAGRLAVGGGGMTLGERCNLSVAPAGRVEASGACNLGQYSNEQGPAMLLNQGTARFTGGAGHMTLRYDSIVTNAGTLVMDDLVVGHDGGRGTFVMTGGQMKINGSVKLATEGSATPVTPSSIRILGGVVTNQGPLNIVATRYNRSDTFLTIDGATWRNLSTGSSTWCRRDAPGNDISGGNQENIRVKVSNGGLLHLAGSVSMAVMDSEPNGKQITAVTTVEDGGTLVCNGSAFRLGAITRTGVDNSISATLEIDDGTFVMTNAGRTATVTLGQASPNSSTCSGSLIIRNNGRAVIDRLAATNGYFDSNIELASGTLQVRDAWVSRGMAQFVGDMFGGSSACWQLVGGGVCRFQEGLTVMAGSSLGVLINASASTGAGCADATDATIFFDEGSRISVELEPGFTPQPGDRWTIGRAYEIYGLPAAEPANYLVSVTGDPGAQVLQIEYQAPEAEDPTLLVVRPRLTGENPGIINAIPWQDSFEQYARGTVLGTSYGWCRSSTDGQSAVALAAAPGGVAFPLQTNHTAVVQLDTQGGWLVNSVSGTAPHIWIDLLARFAPHSANPSSIAGQPHMALFLNGSGRLVTYAKLPSGANGVYVTSEQQLPNAAAWHRVTIHMAYGATPARSFAVYIDGVAVEWPGGETLPGTASSDGSGPWLRMLNTSTASFPGLAFSGNGSLDDVLVTASCRTAALPLISRIAGAARVTWGTDYGRSYTLEACTNLLAPVWQPLRSVTGNGLTNLFDDTASGLPCRFYRLRSE